MTITEFASSRDVKPQTISIFIKRHEGQFKSHIKKVGKTVELDEVAMELLDKQYPLPHPVQLVSGIAPEEHKVLQDKFEAAQEYIIKLQDKISVLQERMMDDQKLLAQAEAQKILLEDKQLQLESAKRQIENLKKDDEEGKKKIDEQTQIIDELKFENERLKNRSFLDRVFNK